MESRVKEAIDYFESKVLKTSGYDATNYFNRKQTIRFIGISKPYFLKCKSKKAKLVKSNFKGVFNEKTSIYYDPSSAGYFNSEYNFIYYNKDYLNLLPIIIHELIHMSSCKNNNQIGFLLTDEVYERYSGLNEGATQWLLMNTIYGDDVDTVVYHLETRIVRLLATAIGHEKLYSHFSKGNFRALNKSVKLYKIKYPIRKIADFMDAFTYYDNLWSSPECPNFDMTLQNGTKGKMIDVDVVQKKILNKIQRIIIDLYFANHSVLDEKELLQFQKLLITKNVDSENVYDLVESLVENNSYVSRYFDVILKKKDKTMYKTIVKSRNNV